jgi:quercetin dioxygenase-like cupin family protein
MSAGSTEATSNKPRAAKRFITTNSATGESVFSATLSETAPSHTGPGGSEIAFNYGTNETPPDFREEKDVASYQYMIDNSPGVIIPNGCVARLVDLPPSSESPMHRTVSLNYNFVIQGRVELILDSGEKRELLPGDMAVQRAVNHAWRNMSDTEWARLTAFAVAAIPPEGMKSTGMHVYK